MRYLGLDIGSKKTGFACSDQGGEIAVGKGKFFTADLPAQLVKILAEHGPFGAIVIGLPKSKSGDAEKAMALQAERVSELAALPVYFQDERLSSWEARERLRAFGYKREKVAELEDQEAAKIILQEYLKNKLDP